MKKLMVGIGGIEPENRGAEGISDQYARAREDRACKQ